MTAPDPAADVTVRIDSLHLYPIKSCGGVAASEALLVETGFDLDRAWMVVDRRGRFVSQRDLPRMALVQPTLKSTEMVLRAPGMLALHVALDAVEQPTRATVWGDTVSAYDMGALCAQWFSDFLGRKVRLVRHDPEAKRLADRRWTGDLAAETAFSDGFPLLVSSVAGLEELNRRLALAGSPAVGQARFRPNIVLSGLDANGEDAVGDIVFSTDAGPVRLRMVKPCMRCNIPDIDPATAAPGHAVGDALARYRADPRMDGAITWGMNAVIVEGIDRVLRTGLQGGAAFRFD